MSPSALRRRVLLSGTMLAAAAVGYGRRAYGACAPAVAPNYLCSGANVTTQTINANNASVSTAPGFSVNAGGNAITITGDGALSYTDSNASSLTAAGGAALYVRSGGDFAGTPGSVTIATNGAISGGVSGIFTRNYGTGALTITANGNVTGTTDNGIYARNSATGTDLSVTTAAGTTVSGGATGIDVRNYGTRALTITANGNVTGTGGAGIAAFNFGSNSTVLTVTTAAGTTVSGISSGIFANNYGTGALTITANGNVTGASYSGISAQNTGTDLTVTTAAGTTVSGGRTGIYALNTGTGALTVTANGNVTGASGSGIYARSGGSPLAITVAATGTVSSTGAAAIETIGAAATVTVGGTVHGGASGAIKFDQATAFANRLELVSGAVINGAVINGAVINGNVLGGTGTDTLGLSGTGSGSFNVAQLASFEAGAKTASGSWTLTGANTGITSFSVGAGTLFVNGSMSNAAVTVSGGTLGGTGTVGNTVVNGGTLSPGQSIGTLTISGSLTMTAAATYLVQVSGSTSDRTTVTGLANLAGTVVVDAPTRLTQKTTYTIMTSSGVNGTFGSASLLVANNLARNPQLSYVGNDVLLTLDPGLLSPILPGNAGANQIRVAGAIDNALLGGSNLSNPFSAIFNLSGNNLLSGLTQLSGESATGSQQTTFNAMGQFMGVLTDPFIDGRGEGPGGGTSTATGYASTQKPAAITDAYAMFTKAAAPSQPSPASGGGLWWGPRWSVWAAGFGGSQTTDGNAVQGSNSSTSRIFGMAAGADYRFSPFTIAGFALAGGGTSFAVNGLGSGRSDLFQAGAFVRHTVGPAYISAALAYGWQDVTTDRTVTIAGLDQLRARFNANAYSGRLEAGYRFVAPWIGGIGITPYAAGQFTTFELPAYAEQAIVGANTFALAYGSKTVTDTRSEIGLRGDKSYAVQDGIFTLRGRLAWAHDFNPDRNIAATFQTLPGASFVVNGSAQARDAALVTASAEKKWRNGWSAAGTFEGEFSGVTRSYAGKGIVRYTW